MTYSLELIKEYLEQNKFDELNQVLNHIISVKEHTKTDYQILKFLEKNPSIAEDSKEIVSRIRNQVEDELKSRGVALKDNEEIVEPVKLEDNTNIDKALPLTVGVKNVTLEERTKLEEYARYLQNRFYEYGLTMKEITFNGGEPHITFLNEPKANNVINNLMIQLNDNKKQKPYVEFELSKLWTTGEETFTLSLLTGGENQNNEIFEMIEDTLDIVESTDKATNYEEKLSPELTQMKKEFSNHTPDLTNEEGNFCVKNIKENGEDKYYLVAETREDAIAYAKELNLSIKDDQYDPNENILPVENSAGSNENLKEAAKTKTLGTMPPPNIRPNNGNEAYSNVKNIILIIALVILVIIVVSIMTLRG